MGCQPKVVKGIDRDIHAVIAIINPQHIKLRAEIKGAIFHKAIPFILAR